MSAQEISGVRLVPSRSPKVSALRLVTSEDVERVRRELAARQATEDRLRKEKASVGGANRQIVGGMSVRPSLLDLSIRVAGFVLAAMVCFVVGLALMNYSAVERGESVVVQAGDTLWSVAVSVPEAPSVSAAMEDIKELNDLRSDVLNVGQGLILPRY